MFHLCFGLKIPHLWETSCASSHFGCFRPPHPAALGFHIKRAVLLDVNPAAWPVQFHVCSLAVLLFQTPLIVTKSACLLFQTTHFSIVKCPMSVVSISIFVGQIPCKMVFIPPERLPPKPPVARHSSCHDRSAVHRTVSLRMAAFHASCDMKTQRCAVVAV